MSNNSDFNSNLIGSYSTILSEIEYERLHNRSARREISKADLISFYELVVHQLKTDNFIYHKRSFGILSDSARISQNALRLHVQYPFEYDNCYEAAAAGDLVELQKMHQSGLPLSIIYYPDGDYGSDYVELTENSTTHAAKNGHLDCLRYAHENGCPCDEWTTGGAARNGHLDCLRYLIENGCPYNIENKEVVEKVKQVTIDIQTTKNIIKNVELNDNVVDHIINKYI